MASFSIRDIECMSGIKCHTLRIWEQRYGILAPQRTETNIRYYNDEDLKCILNISILNRYGYKISDISKMSADEVREAVLKISGNRNEFNCQIKGLIRAMMAFDEADFYEVLNRNIRELGMEKAMLHVVHPFLMEIGILWQVGSIHPSHEHFASNLIKQKLHVAIDGTMQKAAAYAKQFLLFLHEEEQHSLGLLFANYLIRSRGHRVLYLGQEVPLKNLDDTCSGCCPDYVFTTLTSSHPNIDRQQFVNSLSACWQKSTILLAGAQFICGGVQYPANVKVMKGIEDFIHFLEALAPPTE